MAAHPRITQLVERFKDNLDAYKRGKYKEAQLRREFIDPFFGELGWDVQNTQGYAEAYKDVIHEDTIKIGGYTKAPDYCFRIGGVRKFFLEAKRPSTDVKDDVSPAYQLRRYAWSAKLPLSILSDFEEFAIYDCRVKPGKTDKASTARTVYMTFEEYADRWEEIAGVFSREAILKGSFDKYVESSRLKRGTAEVDNAFLEEIERWRTILARNVALRNPGLSQRELNFAVQRTIDRIIFLRICEDRGIESYGELMALQNGPRAYPRLFELFRKADDRYNSGLFHFRSEKGRPGESLDALTSDIKIDDKVLRDILKNLYYPDSPYEFSVLPADILGQVYERFLGSVIRLTPGHRAVVEEKPEVRKAGGVYYTPTYIVDYIVKNTVGELVKDKKPGPRGAVSKLRILDPACGSGSFLLGAYQYLLDWHRDEYAKKNPEKWAKGRKPRLYQGPGGEWKLTTDERKRILLNNIYGVDIDSQAVEVTKLSLLLKVLEGENQETIESQLRLFQERALPDLSNNIKCGNSLIGPDFYEGKQMSLLDDEELQRINAFDWNAEFPGIMRDGGFDAVIGNPPYLFITELTLPEKNYFKSSYSTYSYRYDIYGLFLEKAIETLLLCPGHLGVIIPHTLLNNDSFLRLRHLLLNRTSLRSLVDIGPGVFVNAKNETMLLFTENGRPSGQHRCSIVKSDRNLAGLERAIDVEQRWFADMPKATFIVSIASDEMRLLKRLLKVELKLGHLCTINQGLRTGDNKRFLSAKRTLASHMPAVGGKNVDRYFVKSTLFVQYEPRKLDAPRTEAIFTSPQKIIVQEVRNITLARRIVAAYDDHQLYCLQTTNVLNLRPDSGVNVDLKYLLGLLNSRLLNWYFRLRFASNNHIASNQLAELPIRSIDMSQPTDKSLHDGMVQLVGHMAELMGRARKAKSAPHRDSVTRRMIAADREIDQIVSELYGLTDQENRVVDESLK